MTVKLLTEHHLEFLSLRGGCTGSSESMLVKMPHCWKSHVTVHLLCLLTAEENHLKSNLLLAKGKFASHWISISRNLHSTHASRS